MNYSIWPVKKLSKFLIVWTFPDHNGTSCRSLKVPDFQLQSGSLEFPVGQLVQG